MLTPCFYSSNIHRHCFCHLGIAVSDYIDSKHLFLTFPEAEKCKIKVLAGLVSGEDLYSGLKRACALVFSGKGREGAYTRHSSTTETKHPNTRNFKEDFHLSPTFRSRVGRDKVAGLSLSIADQEAGWTQDHV